MSSYSMELRLAREAWPTIVSQSPVRYGREVPPKVRSVVAIGSGCALPVARFASVLAEDHFLCNANTVTPYEVVNSPAIPDIAFLFSAKGEHRHVLSCYETLQLRGVHTVLVTIKSASPLLDLASRHLDNTTVICASKQFRMGGFIPVESTLVLMCLAAKIFGIKEIDIEPLFDTATADHDRLVNSCRWNKDICTYYVVTSRWGSPAAFDFETRMTEAGFSVASVTDAWNFEHGRYLPLFGQQGRMAVIMSVQGEHSEGERIARVCRGAFPCCLISAPQPEIPGAIYCVIRSMLLVGDFCELQGVDPAVPQIPSAGNMLYEGTDSA